MQIWSRYPSNFGRTKSSYSTVWLLKHVETGGYMQNSNPLASPEPCASVLLNPYWRCMNPDRRNCDFHRVATLDCVITMWKQAVAALGVFTKIKVLLYCECAVVSTRVPTSPTQPHQSHILNHKPWTCEPQALNNLQPLAPNNVEP